MMTFSTENLQRVFAEEGKYEAFRKLCSDMVKRNEIFELDENGVERRVSKSDANKAIQKVFMDICGLTEDKLASKVARKKAIKRHAQELFEVIEEDIEFRVQEGFQNSEWFDQFVEMRNVALGDANEFVAYDKTELIVSEFANDHHDINYSSVRVA